MLDIALFKGASTCFRLFAPILCVTKYYNKFNFMNHFAARDKVFSGDQ